MFQMLMGIISRAASAAYTAVATNFDGTNDYMLRGAGLTGAADSTKVTVCFWVKNASDTGTKTVINTTNAATLIEILGAQARFVFENLTTAQSVDIRSSTGSVEVADGWVNVLFSVDTAIADSARLYIHDVSDKNVTTETTGTLDFTNASWAIGARVNAGNKMNGCLSEVYFAIGEYIDFDTESNRRKFIDASGKPVDLGSDGSTPTGTAPIIYFPNPFGTFEENEGTGGDFTVTGALTACADSPSD